MRIPDDPTQFGVLDMYGIVTPVLARYLRKDIREEEESLYMTLKTFDSFCSSDSNFVTLTGSMFLTVVWWPRTANRK